MTGGEERRERMVIRLFGVLAIEDGTRTLGPRDLGGARPKQVLEILLAARGHRVPTDRLAELLWGEELPQNAAGSLQTFVSVLRRHLVSERERARELVSTEAEAYRFATDRVELDLDRFDELIERSAREPTHLARRSLARALALVGGEVLEDEPYALWAQELRGTYQARVLGAHLDAADAALAELDYADSLAHSEAAAALDRLRERAHRTAMLGRFALARAELEAQHLPALRQILPELALGELPQEFAEVDALEALVALIAAHAPLVLLLDDLHLADSSTVAALGYLQRRCAGIPVALVSAVATEQTSADHPVRRLQPDTLVRLEPLTPAELTPLGIPDLFESTGGNSRFVTEAIARGSQRELSA